MRRFHCGFCDVSFSLAANLHRHERTHAADSHDCPHCNQGFLDAKSLRVHVSRTHLCATQDRDKPFLCRICGKSFRFDFSYDAHLNSHEVPSELRAAALVVLSNGNGKKIMKEFTVEMTNKSGQSVAGSVSVDRHAFIERFVELPVCDDTARENNTHEANEDVVSGRENGRVGVEAKDVNPQTDAVLRELATDSKAVNIRDNVNPSENLDGEKKDEGEPATNGGHVVGSTGPVAGVGSTVRGSLSTVAARTRQRTRTKRRHCSVKTSGENANTCDAYGKSLRSDNSSKVHI